MADQLHTFDIGEELCAVLRAMRERHPWARRAGTFGSRVYTWDRETAIAVRTWLAGIPSVP